MSVTLVAAESFLTNSRSAFSNCRKTGLLAVSTVVTDLERVSGSGEQGMNDVSELVQAEIFKNALVKYVVGGEPSCDSSATENQT